MMKKYGRFPKKNEWWGEDGSYKSRRKGPRHYVFFRTVAYVKSQLREGSHVQPRIQILTYAFIRTKTLPSPNHTPRQICIR